MVGALQPMRKVSCAQCHGRLLLLIYCFYDFILIRRTEAAHVKERFKEEILIIHLFFVPKPQEMPLRFRSLSLTDTMS